MDIFDKCYAFDEADAIREKGLYPYFRAIEAVRKYGASCSGSRFLNGTLTLHEELEGRLAAFAKKEAALVFWKAPFENGVYTNPVLSPAVPSDRTMLRTSYMSIHEDEQLERAAEIIRRVGREVGVIP